MHLAKLFTDLSRQVRYPNADVCGGRGVDSTNVDQIRSHGLPSQALSDGHIIVLEPVVSLTISGPPSVRGTVGIVQGVCKLDGLLSVEWPSVRGDSPASARVCGQL